VTRVLRGPLGVPIGLWASSAAIGCRARGLRGRAQSVDGAAGRRTVDREDAHAWQLPGQQLGCQGDREAGADDGADGQRVAGLDRDARLKARFAAGAGDEAVARRGDPPFGAEFVERYRLAASEAVSWRQREDHGLIKEVVAASALVFAARRAGVLEAHGGVQLAAADALESSARRPSRRRTSRCGIRLASRAMAAGTNVASALGKAPMRSMRGLTGGALISAYLARSTASPRPRRAAGRRREVKSPARGMTAGRCARPAFARRGGRSVMPSMRTALQGRRPNQRVGPTFRRICLPV